MKQNRIILQVGYWVIILMLFTLFFGSTWKSFTLAFYFSIFLIPIVIATTFLFNQFLVPRYLLKGKYLEFSLYFTYLLIASLYLEMLIALVSFGILANFKIEAVELQGISIFSLGITLYLVVFVTSFIRLIIQYQRKEKEIDELLTQNAINNQTHITVKTNRQNQQIELSNLLFIESLDDYVKLVTETETFTTREKISKLEEGLPDNFIRIHRSFIVNKQKVKSYKSTTVEIQNQTLPISRTYKSRVLEELNSNS